MSSTETEYVLITEYFYPDTASTGQLMTDLAVGLEERGLDMTVYTGQPNYHSGDLEKQPYESKHDNVLIKRIRAPQVRQSSLPRRLFNWTVFTLWISIVLLGSASARERELIFPSNPPFLPIAMWIVCKLRGWQYTYIVYDVYPDMAIAPGYLSPDGIIARLWRRIQTYSFQEAKHVVVLGPAMRERILDYTSNSINPENIVIIHNWEDPEFITPQAKNQNPFARENDLLDRFCVLYSGNIGDNHDLTTIVQAAAHFRDEPVTFVIIGEGDCKTHIVDLAEDLNLSDDTVMFFPFQPLDALPDTLTCADVSVVTVSEGMKGVCVSSKLYTSLAAGEPILVISESGDDEARIVESGAAGIHVEQGNISGVVDAVNTWRQNPERREAEAQNARQLFEQHFTEHQSINRYYQLLHDEGNCQRMRDTHFSSEFT